MLKRIIKENDLNDFEVTYAPDGNATAEAENESGKGSMKITRLFDGIVLMRNEYNMAYYDSKYRTGDKIIAIDYCKDGNLAMKCDDGSYQVKRRGSICIDSRIHHVGKALFPTGHYSGITLSLEVDTADRSLARICSGRNPSIDEIRDRFCAKYGYYIFSEENRLSALFERLYETDEETKTGEARKTVLEIIVYLGQLQPDWEERPYFYRDHLARIHETAEFIAKDLSVHHTVAELADRAEIPETAFKHIFMNVYGKPVFQWVTEQRMSKACWMLISFPESRIEEIANKVGYMNAGKFAAAFKRIYGITPRRYRSIAKCH